eukprot:gene22991-27810_t
MDLDNVWNKKIDLDLSKDIILCEEKKKGTQLIVDKNSCSMNYLSADTFLKIKNYRQLSNYFIACKSCTIFMKDLITQCFMNIFQSKFYEVPNNYPNKMQLYMLINEQNNTFINSYMTKIVNENDKNLLKVFMQTGPIMLSQIYYAHFHKHAKISIINIKDDHITDL